MGVFLLSFRLVCTALAMRLLMVESVLLAAEVEGGSHAFFENRIRPVLVENCYSCHSADAKILQGGLRVDFREALRTGGDSGAAVVPGKPEESLLIDALRFESFEMPPEGKLPEHVIADFEQWIRQGATDPREAPADLPDADVVRREDGVLNRIDLEEGRKFWSLQPIADPTPPEVQPAEWVRTPIDAFILKRLAQEQLVPSREADRLTLLRRLKFDLLGLPPTPEEIALFLADESSGAYESLVEQFLASPHYGERWGRHWLDLVRYSDSNGMDENYYFGYAWRYRDYVVQAFNEDKPYDRFLTEQLAGDLLSFSAKETEAKYAALTATGFLALGPKMQSEPDNQKRVMDSIDEMVDVTTKAVLGLSAGCARCHDHKYDPLSHADYYALAGVFRGAAGNNGKHRSVPLMISAEQREELEAIKKVLGEKRELQKTLRKERGRLVARFKGAESEELRQIDDQLKTLDQEIDALKQRRDLIPHVHTMHQRSSEDLPIHIRGSHLNLGKEKIPRGVPKIFAESVTPPEIAPKASGRLELAKWLTDPQHPLTARVMVNRIWQGHFGRGLVETPSDFGYQGSRPSHPKLLDYLAQEFMRSGWSIKAMHRLMVLSSTYRQASVNRDEAAEIDSVNRLLWRQNRRRLEVEPLRDSMLSVAGELELEIGGTEFEYPDGKRVTNDQSANAAVESYASRRRAIYLPVVRVSIYSMFADFDLSDPSMPIDRRNSSVVAPQALFMLNSEFAQSAAAGFAKRMEVDFRTDAAAAVRKAYLLAYGRPPTVEERRLAEEYLETATPVDFCQALLASNEFLYVD